MDDPLETRFSTIMCYHAKFGHVRSNHTSVIIGGSERRTLRAGCSKAEPKKFAPSQTPFPGARDGQNLISCGDGHYLHRQTHFGEDRCTQFRVIVVTDPQTNKPTNKQQSHKQTHKHANRHDRLQYTAPLSLARSHPQCNKCVGQCRNNQAACQ